MNAGSALEEGAWRALPIRAAIPPAELQRRIDAGTQPESAEEYILRVRHQAVGIPDVVVSNAINPRQYDNQVRTTRGCYCTPGTAVGAGACGSDERLANPTLCR